MAADPWHDDAERTIEDAKLGLVCHIHGQAPVQADGRIGVTRFYFRARHSAWTFTAVISHDIDPVALPPHEETPGYFTVEEYLGYFLSGDYGKGHEASVMPYDEAERIIRQCTRQFLQASVG